MTKNLKITYLIARFRPFKGGAELYCWELAKRMADHAEVTVITTDASPDGRKLPSEEIIEGVKIIRLHRWNQQLNLGFYPSLWWKLLTLKTDVIHVVNGPGFIWHEYCLMWKKLLSRRVKFIATPHGPFLAVSNYDGIKKTFTDIARVMMKPYFKIVWPWIFDLVLADNPKQHTWLTSDYRISLDKIRLIPVGIDDSTILSKKPAINNNLPIVITYTNRFEKYKGIHHILLALNKLEERANIPEFHFIAMGRAGEFYSTLKQIVIDNNLEKNVEFIENPTDEVRDDILLNRSQIHILASEWEAFGIVLLEAMAKGNALISSSGNEAAELIIPDDKSGIIYPYGDIDALAGAIEKLLTNDNLRKEIISNNLRHAHNFGWNNVFENYLREITIQSGSK